MGGDAVLLTQQPEKEMLCADIIVVQMPRFLDGIFEHLLGSRRLGEFAHRHHLGTALDELFDFKPNLAKIDLKRFQDVGADPGAFLDQPKQNVLGADVLVVEALGLLIGQRHDLACAVGEAFKHRNSPNRGPNQG